MIFSRTSPEDKLRIVTLLKKDRDVVAVTGDGINDAPALKRADIGVSMGKIGTDVAKESSAIILLDDSFNTLVYAIRE
jgi:Ca2+-transporting ATPase